MGSNTQRAVNNLLGNVTGRDVLAVSPGQAQYERARTYNTRANLLVAGLIALNVGGPMLVEGVGPADQARLIDAITAIITS